jgi:hypothetical protein
MLGGFCFRLDEKGPPAIGYVEVRVVRLERFP